MNAGNVIELEGLSAERMFNAVNFNFSAGSVNGNLQFGNLPGAVQFTAFGTVVDTYLCPSDTRLIPSNTVPYNQGTAYTPGSYASKASRPRTLRREPFLYLPNSS